VGFTLEPTADGRAGAVVPVGNEVRAPERVVFDLPPGAGCYALDNEPAIACPPPAGP
jgi:hypothetical protein